MKKIKSLLALAAFMFILVSTSFAQVSVDINISANTAPPELPEYVQPPCPADGYLWTPGYWAYEDGDYYWVPGVWVRPPHIGYLWTPNYWGYEDGFYRWHRGYWGSEVGFYGGVNYGFGYWGSGFSGGRWEGNAFRYNTAVVNVNRTVVHNTYIDKTVIINHTTINHISYNGGGGIHAAPNEHEQHAMREHHINPTTGQASHEQMARQDKSLFASVNHGKPETPAMNRIGGRPFNQQGHPINAHVNNPKPAQPHTQVGANPNTQANGNPHRPAVFGTTPNGNSNNHQHVTGGIKPPPQPHVVTQTPHEAVPQAPRPQQMPRPTTQSPQPQHPQQMPRPVAPANHPQQQAPRPQMPAPHGNVSGRPEEHRGGQ
ncbi:YXWGXW repeat-containing protein [Parasediminibacterium sp. JCM 36343]|uniref:YXWGXW repeat-containing protein n=1 Tax=Parasediminibacterium sp. JCM 36343 TaxID=3374279 RepID=UPI00397A45D2